MEQRQELAEKQIPRSQPAQEWAMRNRSPGMTTFVLGFLVADAGLGCRAAGVISGAGAYLKLSAAALRDDADL